MKLNAHIPPESAAATVAHRAVMGARAGRAARSAGPRAAALARALRDTARGRAPADEREWIARIEARRAEIPFEMAAADTQFAIVPADADADAGGGAAAGNGDGTAAAPEGAVRLAQAWEICRWTSIPPIWGRFLTRLVRELAPVSCLELGTGLGLSGAYQGAALELNESGRLVTVDVHEAARIAEHGFATLGLDGRVEAEFGLIEERLDELLGRIAPVDFAFLDAEHSEQATIRHFDAVLPQLADGAVVVLDDVTQTDEMRRAWRTVIGRERVATSLGLRRVGVVVLEGPAGDPR